MELDQGLWDAFLLQLPGNKRDKIGALIEALPAGMREGIKQQLMGINSDDRDQPSESHVSPLSEMASDRGDDEPQDLNSAPEFLSEIRNRLYDDQSAHIMDEILSHLGMFIHDHVGKSSYDAEIDRKTLFAAWRWFWFKEADDGLVVLMGALVKPDQLSKAFQRSSIIERVRQRLIAPLHAFHSKLLKDETLQNWITKGEAMPRLSHDLWDIIALLSGYEVISLFASSLPKQLPPVNRIVANQLFIQLKKYEKEPNTVFTALCMIICTRLKTPQDIIQIAVYLSENGMVLKGTPFVATLTVLLARIDQLTSSYERLAKKGKDVGLLADIITEYAAYSRAFRINVNEAIFPEYYRRYVDFQRDFSIKLEGTVRSIGELTRRILRTLSWIKNNPKLWLCDGLDVSECYDAVYLFYTLEKVSSEFSLITVFSQTKKDFEDYIEYTLKGLIVDGENLDPEDLDLFQTLTGRCLDFARFSFEASYHQLLSGQLDQIIAEAQSRSFKTLAN